MAITSEMSAGQKSLVIKVTGRFDFSLHEGFRCSYRELASTGSKVVVDMGCLPSFTSTHWTTGYWSSIRG